MTDDLSSPFGIASVLVKEQRFVLLCGKEPRTDRVDSNAFGGPFSSKKLCEVQNCSLCSGIGDHSRKRNHARHGCNVNDTAASLFQHGFSKYLSWQKRASDKIQVKDSIPCVLWQFTEVGAGRQCRVGAVTTSGADQDADGTQLTVDCVSRRSK